MQLLSALVDPDPEGTGEYRFLVAGKHVKYVVIDGNVVPQEDRAFGPALIPQLPKFPPGNWNDGHISKDQVSGEAAFTYAEHVQLEGIQHQWHPRVIDHLELTKVGWLRPNIHRVKHTCFGDTIVVAKFAEFPWQIPFFESETTAYSWLEGNGIGPKFLGHLAEEGRIFGFLIEDIGDAPTATIHDLAICEQSLRQLHDLGIKHGDINKHNFVIKEGQAVLIDFERAEKCSDGAELKSEMLALPEALSDTSCRGGIGPPEY